MTPEQAATFAATTADLAVLFRLGTPTPFRVWSGAGDMPVPADAIEPLYLRVPDAEARQQ